MIFEVCPLSNKFFDIFIKYKNLELFKDNIIVCSDDNNRLGVNLITNYMYLLYRGVSRELINKFLENR